MADDVTSATPTLEDQGIHLIMGAIDDTTVKEATRFILQESLKKTKPEYLQLIINSGGGSLDAGFGLVDIIEGASIPVYTTGIGIVGSAALCIFIAGAKGHRIMTPNTMVLSHQYSWGTFGKHHELIAANKAFHLTHDLFLKHYKKHTGLTEADIIQYLLPPEDCWLSAKEAKKYNLCDKIAKL